MSTLWLPVWERTEGDFTFSCKRLLARTKEKPKTGFQLTLSRLFQQFADQCAWTTADKQEQQNIEPRCPKTRMECPSISMEIIVKSHFYVLLRKRARAEVHGNGDTQKFSKIYSHRYLTEIEKHNKLWTHWEAKPFDNFWLSKAFIGGGWNWWKSAKHQGSLYSPKYSSEKRIFDLPAAAKILVWAELN